MGRGHSHVLAHGHLPSKETPLTLSRGAPFGPLDGDSPAAQQVPHLQRPHGHQQVILGANERCQVSKMLCSREKPLPIPWPPWDDLSSPARVPIPEVALSRGVNTGGSLWPCQVGVALDT